MSRSMKAVAFTHLSVSNPQDVRSSAAQYIQAFDACDNIGLVYLFLSGAYKAFITGRDVDTADSNERRIRSELKKLINGELINGEKFQIVGMKELSPLLESLDNLAANANMSLEQLVLGRSGDFTYDCSKVVEAFIRIARRYKPEPILRFDADVAVKTDAVERLIDQYIALTGQGKQYFFFSGSYSFHDPNTETETHWLNDYSVRTHFLSTRENDETPFQLDCALAKHFVDTISKIGAPVKEQPISGAGLCMSPLAIVQFPPFANVAQNIMWIDDSIKRALHEGVGNLDSNDICQVHGAAFEQNRYPEGIQLKDMQWACRTYFPRLTLGCLMQGLMSEPSAVPEVLAEYIRIRRKPTEGERRRWAEVAIARINEMKKIWSDSLFSSPAGKMLKDFADTELNINQNGCRQVIEAVVKNPRADIADLCNTYSLPEGRNAGAYIAQVIADLEQYFDLMELWPFIIRTVDFQTRNPSQLTWLGFGI
jgi:hypothetical protein